MPLVITNSIELTGKLWISKHLSNNRFRISDFGCTSKVNNLDFWKRPSCKEQILRLKRITKRKKKKIINETTCEQ